jgi:hypothetical protein
MFPTAAETRAAARRGDHAAIAELANVEQREHFLARAERLELRDGSGLPNLPGDQLVFEWDLEEREGEKWTVVRAPSGEVVCAELAYWEGYERFGAVFEILAKCYGRRFAGLAPTAGSELYLYGDRIGMVGYADRLNATLPRRRRVRFRWRRAT